MKTQTWTSVSRNTTVRIQKEALRAAVMMDIQLMLMVVGAHVSWTEITLLSKILPLSQSFLLSFTACNTGFWGPSCINICNCRTPDTVCNASLGCAECNPGVTGGSCDQDINECNTTFPCGELATCSNAYGTYVCTCNPGYESIDGNNCTGKTVEIIRFPHAMHGFGSSLT